jgi:hypothetical protein
MSILIDATGLRVKRIRGRTLPQSIMFDFQVYDGSTCPSKWHRRRIRQDRLNRKARKHFRSNRKAPQ